MSRLLAGLLVLAACGDDADEGPSRRLVVDVADLQRAMGDDLAVLALEEVEDAVADDLPARAAQLLERGAIPATERQRATIAALEMSTDEGVALRDRAVALVADRKAALEAYREVLARGLMTDDLAMLDAITAQREAEEALTAFFAELELIRPLPEIEDDAPQREVRSPR
ncbi:MAG: hypothetical protein CMN30_21710 [Sandaracinus sp.]|nr:hypothetical protein [Sandaracinus sp.]